MHDFAGGADGINPRGTLVDVNGELYGVTSNGGAFNLGTVFKINHVGVESIVHSFGTTASDGASPVSGLVYANGFLYGTTSAGGGTITACRPTGCDTIYQISP